MIDLSQVSLALRNATAKSLILLDEFGNGTTPAGSHYVSLCPFRRFYASLNYLGSYSGLNQQLALIIKMAGHNLMSLFHPDGAGLFCAVIQHLLGLHTKGISCTPKVLAATHFHEIFTNGLLNSRLRIEYMHMEAMLSKTSGQLVGIEDATAAIGADGNDVAEQIEIHYLYRLGQIPLHARRLMFF